MQIFLFENLFQLKKNEDDEEEIASHRCFRRLNN